MLDTDTTAAVRSLPRISLRSSSKPTMNMKITRPTWATMFRYGTTWVGNSCWSRLPGKAPSRVGPSTIPAKIFPMTAG